MKLPKLTPATRTALRLAFSIGLLAVLVRQVDWARALDVLSRAHAPLIVVLIGLYTADRILMALKWHQLLAVFGRVMSRRAAIRVYYESSFVGFAMPLGGLGPDIVRYAQLRARGTDSHLALASMVMERYVGLVAMLAVAALGLAALAALAPQDALAAAAGWIAAGAGAGAMVGAGLLLSPGAYRRVDRVVSRTRLATRAIVAKLLAAIRTYSTRRGLLAANLGLSLIEQTASMFAYFIASRALDTPLPLIVCLAVAPVTVLIQRLPISYAGLGLREASATSLLVALGYDYSEVMLMLLMQFVVFFLSLLPGAVIFLRHPTPAPETPPDVQPEAAEPADEAETGPVPRGSQGTIEA